MIRLRSATIVLVAALIGCTPAPSPSESRVLHRGLSGDPATLDPAMADDTFSHEVLGDLYEGLTSESPAGEVEPGAAASWDVDTTGRVYTFHLRPTARWSNGQPVTAQNFVSAWQRVVDPKQGSPAADNLRLIANAAQILAGSAPISALGAKAPDDFTLIVHLEQPAPYFPQLLSHTAAYPIYAPDSAKSRSKVQWASNGAYVIENWTPGTAVTLKKNPVYWNQASVHIPTVQFAIASDVNVQYARYRAGELDLTDNVPENAAVSLRRERPAELVTAPILATGYYALNLKSLACARESDLRQALSMAIDRKRLVAMLAFGQAPAYGFVPPGTSNYTPQSWDWQSLSDREREAQAKRLYASAGCPSRSRPKVRLLLSAGPSIHQIALAMVSMWHDTLGLEVELETEEYRVFLDSRRDKTRWEIARLAWNADFNDAGNFLDTMRSASPNNDSGYVNPPFDTLLDLAAASADPSTRRALLEQAERTMLADYPIIPVYYFVSKRLVTPALHGVIGNPLNRIRSQSLSFAP